MLHYLNDVDLLTGPVITELPLDERKLIGHRKKERGNFWYARQDYSNAVQCYRYLEYGVPLKVKAAFFDSINS